MEILELKNTINKIKNTFGKLTINDGEEKSDKKIQNEAQKDEMREENTKKYSQKTWEKRCNICVIGIPERRMRIWYKPLLKK